MCTSGDMTVLDQPCAFKLVYEPDDHYVSDYCLIRDDSGGWHLFYIYHPFDQRGSHNGDLEPGTKFPGYRADPVTFRRDDRAALRTASLLSSSRFRRLAPT